MLLYETVERVQTREDFITFIETLQLEDYDEWENPDLMRYLGALAGYARDIDGAYLNAGREFPEQPTWRILAELLYGAAYYE